MAATEPKHRFSDRVNNYVKYRPGYPPEVMRFLSEKFRLGKTSTIADIGSGTGIFSALLLKTGATVYGVEPNGPMRAAAEEALGSLDRFHSMSGSAEHTGLPPHSIDLVTAATAFHWFDLDKSKAEFLRILRPGGHVALIWNIRDDQNSQFSLEYESLLTKFGTDYSKINSKKVAYAGNMAVFFGQKNFAVERFPHFQEFDFKGLKGRLLSSSYAPNEGHPKHAEMLQELKLIFDRCQVLGTVRIVYETKLYWGPLDSAVVPSP